MKTKILILIMLSFSMSVLAQQIPEDKIREAVNRQLETYPQSSLRDLYKNFFQDRFGPGHIVRDTTSAGKYLREELAERDAFSASYYEQTGCSGNYYRVNLSLIKEGIIPYQVFFDAFIRSVKEVKPIAVEEWRREWQMIEPVITEMNLHLSDYEKDKSDIRQLLERGEYVMHHSRRFIESYNPHYRIISREIFEKELLPLINKNNKQDDK